MIATGLRYVQYLVPDMPNICNILTTIGHRFGHQSGLDESAGLNSTTFLYGTAFRVYLVFSQISKTQDIDKY